MPVHMRVGGINELEIKLRILRGVTPNSEEFIFSFNNSVANTYMDPRRHKLFNKFIRRLEFTVRFYGPHSPSEYRFSLKLKNGKKFMYDRVLDQGSVDNIGSHINRFFDKFAALIMDINENGGRNFDRLSGLDEDRPEPKKIIDLRADKFRWRSGSDSPMESEIARRPASRREAVISSYYRNDDRMYVSGIDSLPIQRPNPSSISSTLTEEDMINLYRQLFDQGSSPQAPQIFPQFPDQESSIS